MKKEAIGIIKLTLSLFIVYLIDTFFFAALDLIGIDYKDIGTGICITIKYLLMCLSIFGIYYPNIKGSYKNINRSKFATVIFCLACFLFLVFITIILHQTLNLIGKSKGIIVNYDFKNYFNHKFSFDILLNIVVESIFIPFLICVIFPLGFSNIFKKDVTATIVSGLVYGIFYGLMLNSNLLYTIFCSITPACIVMLLTYLYKVNNNIVSVIITYSIYVLFGIFAINYIL